MLNWPIMASIFGNIFDRVYTIDRLVYTIDIINLFIIYRPILSCYITSIILVAAWHLGYVEDTKKSWLDFPGGSVVRTQHFQCKGQGFDPWSGN